MELSKNKKQAPEAFRFAAVAVDVVIFGVADGKLHVLIQDINLPPHYVHVPGFPGGIVTKSETTDDAVQRHLRDKTNLTGIPTEQFYTFSDLDRDKRNRVISIAHLGFISREAMANYKNDQAEFVPVSQIKKLAYDHNDIYKKALERLRDRAAHTTIARYFLPQYFTLTELQEVHEVVMGKKFDKRNFRKKILSLNIIKDTKRVQKGVKNRPATLYVFKHSTVKNLSVM